MYIERERERIRCRQTKGNKDKGLQLTRQIKFVTAPSYSIIS